MMKRFLLALALLLGAASAAPAQMQQRMSQQPPGWAQVPLVAMDCDWQNFRGYNCPITSQLVVARASTGTDLLPSSPSGASFNTFANNVLRWTPGVGILIEESRTNQLLNSGTPATQTTASLAASAQTIWVNGPGSATMSSGTGVGCGTGVATQGTPVTFTLTTAGTCTVTVSGSLNEFQLEAGSFGTSYIPTAGAPVTRAADVVTFSGRLATFFTEPNAIMVQTYLVQNTGANVLSYDNGGSTIINTTGSTAFYSRSGGVNTTNATCSGAGMTTSIERVFYQSTASGALRQIMCNGGAFGSASSGLINNGGPSSRLGSSNGVNYIDGYVQRFAVWGFYSPASGVQANCNVLGC